MSGIGQTRFDEGWIASPLLTDLYQLTMLQSYVDGGMQDEAVFEFFVRRLPPERNFLVAAGLAQLVDYLTTLRFETADLDALAETGLFHDAFLKYLERFEFTRAGHGAASGTGGRRRCPARSADPRAGPGAGERASPSCRGCR